MIKILIACGSGIATSTYAENSVKEICKEIGIAVKTYKSNITDAINTADSVDLVLFTTNNWKKFYDADNFPKPAMSVAPLIMGFGVDECKVNLINMLQKIQERQKTIK